MLTILTRVFNYQGTELPDPSPEMSEQEVLEHYSRQYSALRRGKVEQISESGDKLIFELKNPKFQPDG